MAKHSLYSTFMSRMKSASGASMYLEASWYAYVVLEDRLVSLLQNSGGIGSTNGGSGGKPITMMGPKLQELKRRAKKDPLLKANFEYTALNDWKESRNNLMHAMADATMSLKDIDAAAKQLAEDGSTLVKTYASAARRVKAHRDKVSVET